MTETVQMKDYGVDVPGRLAKTRISNPLFAVYEAITNSIHAIEEIDPELKNGSIEVEFFRSSQMTMDAIGTLPEIIGLKITDNGVGFTEQNFKSFLTFDSTYKKNLGGKGVGRLTWLKFFTQVSIESSYHDTDSNDYYNREFDFSEKGVEEKQLKASDSNIKTIIRMTDLTSSYSFPKNLETIAGNLIEHFLSYFSTNHAPKIVLRDGSNTIELNKKFQEEYGQDIYPIDFKIKNVDFKLTCLKVSTLNTGNKIFLCAHKRTITKPIDLKSESALFKKKLRTSDGEEFYFVAFLESKYLDDHVNDNRTGFEFGEEDEGADLFSSINLAEIKATVVDVIKGDLKEELTLTRDENLSKAKGYISTKKPQFKYLLNHKEEQISEISAEDDKTIYEELRKLQYEFETESDAAAEEILTELESPQGDDEFEKRKSELYEKIEDRKKMSLAQYICDRRVILDILSKRLAKNTDDKYELEDAIHKLIFPLKKTSDDLNYDDQNLWVLDERLCYHNYLASDIPLSKQDPLEIESKDRPDIIIFNGPVAVTNSASDFDAVTVVEFKRPNRNDYSASDNPIDQVLNYVLKIRNSKNMADKNGRNITVPENLRFYCYIVCDITQTLQPIIQKYSAKKSPDGKGFYFSNEPANAHIEIIPYDKLLSDATKRNQFLFEKLGLPTK